MVGTGMLWVGWYGFNAGSAVAADTIAANAFTTTTIATAVACAAWPAAEWITRGNPTVLGLCCGVLAGVVPFIACTKLKHALGYDDALDTFGVHAIGGTLGAFLTGIFANSSVNPNLDTNLKDIVGSSLWLEQLKAMGLTVVLAVAGTVILGFGIKATMGLRPSEEDEETGLDLSDHGERGYHVGDVT